MTDPIKAVTIYYCSIFIMAFLMIIVFVITDGIKFNSCVKNNMEWIDNNCVLNNQNKS